jgi:hypothetical protein
MNLFINGFHQKESFPIILGLLRHFNVKHCHLTFDEQKIDTPSNIEAIFYDVRKIVLGGYGIDWAEITPIDEELIEKMSDCEVVMLKMMDRLPQNLSLSYEDRKRLYLKHLRFWNHVIENNSIDLFLFSSPPHETYDYVIYSLCKLKKIPTILFFQTRVFDTITMFEDVEENVYGMQAKYQELLEKYESVDESLISLSGRFKKDFEMNMEQKDPVRFEMLREKPSHNNLSLRLKKFDFYRIGKFIRKGILVKKIINYFDRTNRDDRILQFYKKQVILPDLSKKYIYFPLHLQPEASTSPMAGAYVDQILIAQMIAYYIPKDVLIYVKENPFQAAAGRDMEFYKDLLRIANVRFVPDSFSSFALINNSLCVATATGTAGWEALYRRKPVLMFGHNFYQYAKGVFRIKTITDCRRALDKIILENYMPNLKDLKIFLKALEATTIEGYVDLDYKKDTNVTDFISNKNILDNLIKKIDTIFNQKHS